MDQAMISEEQWHVLFVVRELDRMKACGRASGGYVVNRERVDRDVEAGRAAGYRTPDAETVALVFKVIQDALGAAGQKRYKLEDTI